MDGKPDNRCVFGPEKYTFSDGVRKPLLDAIFSAYGAWLPVAERSKFSIKEPPSFEPIYMGAVNSIKPILEKFTGISRQEAEAIIRGFGRQKFEGSGIFLSALLNESGLQESSGGFFEHDIIGYRIPRGKTIVAREGSFITSHLGCQADGDVLNFGFANRFAEMANGGVQLNFGKAACMANSAEGGVQVNFGVVGYEMAKFANGGIQINFGVIHPFDQGMLEYGRTNMAELSSGGIQINFGTIENGTLGCAWGGVQINFGKVLRGKGHESYGGILLDLGYASEISRTYPQEKLRTAMPYIKGIEERARQLEHLKHLKSAPPEQAAKEISKYDWETFQCEVSELGKKIEKALR